MTAKTYFPWRFFLRLFISQFFLFAAVVAVIGTAFYYLGPLPQTFSTALMLEAYLWFLPAAALASAWFSYRWAYQFGRIILKARRMASKKFARVYDFSEQDLFEEETDEFVELASVLNRIRRKLKRKREQLAYEQEQSQAVLSSVGDAVVRVDRDEQVTYFNARFASHFMESEQLATMPMLASVFREPEILESFKVALQQEERREISTVRVLDPAGEERFYSLTVNPLVNRKTESVYGAIGSFHDITEMKQAELIRIEFVANASHELRTPLTSLKGYVDTLKEDIGQDRHESSEKFVDIISRNVGRLIDLVNDLLTISTLESQNEFRKESVDLKSATDHVLRQLTAQAQEKDIEIVCRVEASEIYGDTYKVEQVLINLITNAIKYIPSGRHIEVSWVQVADDSVELRVKDDGPGIAKEHLARLFERFYRIDRGRSRDAGGTGLGLAIVKHIMQNHGGRVQVKSELGAGTEFTCTFPLSSRRF